MLLLLMLMLFLLLPICCYYYYCFFYCYYMYCCYYKYCYYAVNVVTTSATTTTTTTLKTKFWLKTRCQLLCIGRRHDDVRGQWTPISILCVDVHMGLDPPPLPSTCVQPDSFSPSVWTS